MSKVLVLMNARWPIDRYYIKYSNLEGVDVTSIYKLQKKNIWYSLAALHIEILKGPFQSFWYGKWKKKLLGYDVVIVFNCMLSVSVLDYIHRMNRNARLIFWHWDSVNDDPHLKPLTERYKAICEEWSFDEYDCAKYGFKKNVQFYIPMNYSSIEANSICLYDFLIVMKDKGRYKTICNLTRKLEYEGFKVYTRVIPDLTTIDDTLPYYGDQLTYEELLKMTFKAKCVVELVREGQHGVSLRSMEALFYSKKLLTNNAEIRKEEYFKPSNIFVMEKDSDISGISKFLNMPYTSLEKEIIDNHSFSRWIKNFGGIGGKCEHDSIE